MVKSYFRSSGFMSESVIKTSSGNIIDIETLPAFLRTLLVMDGTVTKSLEAWFWEAVNVISKHNEVVIVTERVNGLEVSSGDQVLQREVDLRGEKTKRIFATAKSTVSLQHLPKDVGDALCKGHIGIGELLRDKELETYRDIFDINYLPHPSGGVISRSYRIWVNGKPTIIVSEFFPINIYQKN